VTAVNRKEALSAGDNFNFFNFIANQSNWNIGTWHLADTLYLDKSRTLGHYHGYNFGELFLLMELSSYLLNYNILF